LQVLSNHAEQRRVLEALLQLERGEHPVDVIFRKSAKRGGVGRLQQAPEKTVERGLLQVARHLAHVQGRIIQRLGGPLRDVSDEARDVAPR
jgi:hypothetical protein